MRDFYREELLEEILDRLADIESRLDLLEGAGQDRIDTTPSVIRYIEESVPDCRETRPVWHVDPPLPSTWGVL